ncbi:MAG: hypothetical protein ACJAR3_001805 [Roseivirga sp.]|jgi:hypothetical protein
MEMNSTKHLIILLLLISITSCSADKSAPYEAAIQRYFDEAIEVDQQLLQENPNVLIIPIGGCSPCLIEVMNHLSRLSLKNTLLVIVDRTLDRDIIKLEQKLSAVYPIVKDPENQLMLYRTNISNPTLLKFERKQITVTSLTLDNYEYVLRKFNEDL